MIATPNLVWACVQWYKERNRPAMVKLLDLVREDNK